MQSTLFEKEDTARVVVKGKENTITFHYNDMPTLAKDWNHVFPTLDKFLGTPPPAPNLTESVQTIPEKREKIIYRRNKKTSQWERIK